MAKQESTLVKIADAKKLAKRDGHMAVIVLAFNENGVEGASYGEDRKACDAAGKVMSDLIEVLCDNEIDWPLRLMPARLGGGKR